MPDNFTTEAAGMLDGTSKKETLFTSKRCRAHSLPAAHRNRTPYQGLTQSAAKGCSGRCAKHKSSRPRRRLMDAARLCCRLHFRAAWLTTRSLRPSQAFKL
ncbi:MAG TPA: hypothetical protein VFU55_12555 [Terracidiphilus sp.]|nr:hypothetical protein [Terracidiphilus sp.]